MDRSHTPRVVRVPCVECTTPEGCTGIDACTLQALADQRAAEVRPPEVPTSEGATRARCGACPTPYSCDFAGVCLGAAVVGPPIPEPGDDRTHFGTGAKRSSDANHLRFDLIHPLVKLALAAAYAEGQKYGDHNWEQGMPVHDLWNHVERHVTLWFAGDRSEKHLAKALWGLGAMVVSEQLWPDLNAPHLRGPGCTLTDAKRARIAEENADYGARKARFAHLGRGVLADLPEVALILQQRKGALGGDPDAA